VNDGRRPSVPREVPLLELLDRALGAGVVITGDVTLSLAGIDLVHLDLQLLVASADRLAGTPPDRSAEELPGQARGVGSGPAGALSRGPVPGGPR
jgi:hypothetical protein